jgi:hypothetical protein
MRIHVFRRFSMRPESTGLNRGCLLIGEAVPGDAKILPLGPRVPMVAQMAFRVMGVLLSLEKTKWFCIYYKSNMNATLSLSAQEAHFRTIYQGS